MQAFAKNIRNRAAELGLSNAEVARRLGLSEGRFAHYVTGRNEPDLALLAKIATVLKTSPNELLSFEKSKAKASAEAVLLDRIQSDCLALSKSDLEIVSLFTKALASRKR